MLGSSLPRRSSVRCSRRTRSSSCWGKSGDITISPSISRPRGQCLDRVSVDTRVYSRRLSTERRAPMNSKSLAICWLDLPAAPSDSISPTSPARPGRWAGSSEAPAPSNRPKATMGIPGCSTTVRPIPLGRRSREGRGGVNAGSAAGGGIMVRSTVVAAGDSGVSGSTRSRTRLLAM